MLCEVSLWSDVRIWKVWDLVCFLCYEENVSHQKAGKQTVGSQISQLFLRQLQQRTKYLD